MALRHKYLGLRDKRLAPTAALKAGVEADACSSLCGGKERDTVTNMEWANHIAAPGWLRTVSRSCAILVRGGLSQRSTPFDPILHGLSMVHAFHPQTGAQRVAILQCLTSTCEREDLLSSDLVDLTTHLLLLTHICTCPGTTGDA